MNPIATLAVALDEEFIVVSAGTIGDIQQDGGIADGLLDAYAADIHSATCQVIAGRRTTCQFIHFWRTIAAGDDERDLFLVPIEFMIGEPQFFQPVLTEILQVLNSHTAGDVTISRLVAGLGNLPEREVLGEANWILQLARSE